MGMRKKLLLTTAALLLVAVPVFAGEPLADACGAKGNPCPAPSAPVPQPAYPFEKPVEPAPDADLDKLRSGMVNDNLKSMLGPGEIGSVNNHKLDAQGASSYPGYAGQNLPDARRKDIAYVRGQAQAPQQIWLAQNVPSPVVFQDKAGNPWPIASITYDPRIYSINGQGCGQSNDPKAVSEDRPTVLTVTVCKFWTWGTFTVQLQDINIPVVFVAGSGKNDEQKYVDVPIVVHIDGRSPTAKKPVRVAGSGGGKPRAVKPRPAKVASGGPSSAYQAFLSGVAPSGAVRVGTTDGQSSAWYYNGNVYLVGPYKVITPDYDAIASSDNLNLFRFAQSTSRVLVADANGAQRAIIIGN